MPRTNLKNKLYFAPLPVGIIGTYDSEGKANAMNAAWCGIYDYDTIYVSLSKTIRIFQSHIHLMSIHLMSVVFQLIT